MRMQFKPATMGIIVSNRGFFPTHLCSSGRKTTLKMLEQEGIEAVCHRSRGFHT